MFVEGTIRNSHHDEFISYLVDRLKFLFLQLTEVPIYSEITHVLCIFLDLVYEIFVGDWGVAIAVVVGGLTAHQYLFPHYS